MAVIEYRITVDASGNARVEQDVRRIDTNDVLIFSTDNKNVPAGRKMAIEYQDASPFLTGANPLADQAFVLQTGLGPKIDTLPAGKKHKVQQESHVKGIKQAGPFGIRTTFHFNCGHAKPDGTDFAQWAGTPGGNSGSVGD